MANHFYVVSFLIFTAEPHQTQQPCHSNGPAYNVLSCDSSADQIISSVEQGTEQKPNLIIFDVDFTILESTEGFHQAIPSKHRQPPMDPTAPDFNLIYQREILFIHSPKSSIIFRKHFFEFLKYIHTDIAYSADMILYASARPTYTQQVAQGITQCFKKKYRNISVDGMLIRFCLILCA